MKKIVNIAGIGMSKNQTSREVLDCIRAADVIIGAKRMVDEFSGVGKQIYISYKPAEIANFIDNSDYSRYAVLVSGDVGFFSGATALSDALSGHNPGLLAGVSSLSGFFAKLKTPWQNCKFMSMHGVKADIVGAVRRNRQVFCLTGGNTSEIGERLTQYGLGSVKVYTGENLGYPDEKITEMCASDLAKAKLSPLTVILVENPDFNPRIPAGIEDESFIRLDGVPMTKSEVRAVVMSKLRLAPDDVVYDIGAGTGSVTVEAAFAAYEGHVYAVEKNENAIEAINKNLTRFMLGNVTVAAGNAEDVIDDLPSADAVFIGGGGKSLGLIISKLAAKKRPVRIVVSAIALETVATAMNALKQAGFEDMEILQLQVARAKVAGDLHLMIAQNPITIISGGLK